MIKSSTKGIVNYCDRNSSLFVYFIGREINITECILKFLECLVNILSGIHQ